ncbi:hypothetical protein [Leifsonia aquatica]|uniref:hypothetical protein n=1 Tax=Leifsonia aquatica TaxID=144185 RepID=UPI000468E073|nr:hypothetical protein [Leifsonia aquatica]
MIRHDAQRGDEFADAVERRHRRALRRGDRCLCGVDRGSAGTYDGEALALGPCAGRGVRAPVDDLAAVQRVRATLTFTGLRLVGEES